MEINIYSDKLTLLFPLLISLFLPFSGHSQKILDERVSLQLKNCTLEQALSEIEQQSSAGFAYNADITRRAGSVSVVAENIKVRDALDRILSDDYKYETAGKHIILLPNEKKTKSKQKKITYTLSGKICDASSGKALRYASIYEADQQFSEITDSEGRFEFQIKSIDSTRALVFSKTGYRDTALTLRPGETRNIRICLHPIPEYHAELPEKPLGYESGIPEKENILPAKQLLPERVSANASNLEYLDNVKNFQLSVLPGLSSNLSKYGVTENRVSVNVLAGYSKGVQGFETAGLANFTKQNVNGLQIAGLLNHIGGDLNGWQIAGLLNAGTNNITGTQIAGLANFNKVICRGAQISVFNYNGGSAEGLQIAALANRTGEIRGVQIAGLLNYAESHTEGFRVAAIGNYAKTGTSDGLQIAAVFNRSYHQKGLQFALVNINDTSEGFEAGLFSYVRRGYREHEFSVDQLNAVNYIFRTGNHLFYNILQTAFDTEKTPTLTFGYGIGTRPLQYPKFSVSAEFSYHLMLSNAYETFALYDYSSLGIYGIMPIGETIRLTAGPNINFHFVYDPDNPIRAHIEENSYLPFYSGEYSSMYIGFRAGIRL